MSNTTLTRKLTLTQAKARYVHRYTMEHVPAWAAKPIYHDDRKQSLYYAPQYRTDKEWYENTTFFGESDMADPDYCYSNNQSWPLGQWLEKPYSKG